jgi:hypothetical protein
MNTQHNGLKPYLLVLLLLPGAVQALPESRSVRWAVRPAGGTG